MPAERLLPLVGRFVELQTRESARVTVLTGASVSHVHCKRDFMIRP